MAATVESPTPPPSPLDAAAGNNLKARLTDRLMSQRTLGQLVKVAQVSKNHFRVNWLTPVEVPADAIALRTYKMTRSQFLRVDELNGELVITDQTHR
jgi:hypothetical protein